MNREHRWIEEKNRGSRTPIFGSRTGIFGMDEPHQVWAFSILVGKKPSEPTEKTLFAPCTIQKSSFFPMLCHSKDLGLRERFYLDVFKAVHGSKNLTICPEKVTNLSKVNLLSYRMGVWQPNWV
jgi:hypothetical protein